MNIKHNGLDVVKASTLFQHGVIGRNNCLRRQYEKADNVNEPKQLKKLRKLLKLTSDPSAFSCY